MTSQEVFTYFLFAVMLVLTVTNYIIFRMTQGIINSHLDFCQLRMKKDGML